MTTVSPTLISYRRSQQFFRLIIHLIMILVGIAMVVPFLLVISVSLSDEVMLSTHGYQLIPLKISTFAYDYIFRSPESLVRSYGVTSFVTLSGTFFGLLFMSMLAYGLARITGKTRSTLTVVILFTILFSGGLIPFYLVMTRLYQMKNNLLALIFPYLVSPFYVLLLRSYFNQLPQELLEAAKIDGASEYRIFFQIALPLSMPALATIGLFTLLNYWNDYWLSLLFISDSKLYPLQYLLYSALTSADALRRSPGVANILPPTHSLRMAIAVIAAGPAVFVSLALGKYFVRGITLGALK
jgi:putative aldouronate transport system permease protein